MILNEFFNLPQVFEKDMDEGTRERLSNLHDKIRKEKGLPDPKEYLKIAQQKKKEIADLKAQDKKDPGMEEGIFGSRPSPVLPVVDKIAKVASGLTPQNVEVGKQIIQNKASEITRMLSPQTKPGVDVIEQGVAEDSTAHDCKHCNGKGYHTVTKKDGTKVATNCPQCKGKGYIVTKGMAEGVRTESAELAKQYGWAYNQGEYGASMTHPKHGRISLSSPVTSRSGDTAVEREWTHNNASGIGNRSLAQHLQSLKEQGIAEGKDDYVPPKEADYGPEYQAMVRRVGEKARAQEKAKQQQQPKAPVRESRLALLKQIIQS